MTTWVSISRERCDYRALAKLWAQVGNLVWINGQETLFRAAEWPYE